MMQLDRIGMYWSPDLSNREEKYRVATLDRHLCKVHIKEVFLLWYHQGRDDFEKALTKGFDGYPAFPIREDDYIYMDILPTFKRRICDRNRGDFKEYLKKHGIPEDSDLDDFSLLGYCGGKLPGDGFSFKSSE